MCRITEKSRACDCSVFDCNTILVGSDVIGYNEYVFISRFEINIFSTDDEIRDFIYLMGISMIPSDIAVGEKYTYFSSDQYKLFENERNNERTFLNFTNNSVDAYDYHVLKCDEGAFKTLSVARLQFLPK